MKTNIIKINIIKNNIKITQTHLKKNPSIYKNIKYIQTTIKNLIKTNKKTFDTIITSKIIKHISNINTFLTSYYKIIKI